MTMIDDNELDLFSVYGCFTSGERFADALYARDASRAEQRAVDENSDDEATLWVCAVVRGEVPSVDTYTAYVDPDDPRNADCPELELDLIALEAQEYTVFGIARNPHNRLTYECLIGERYAKVIVALSPREAEDIARNQIEERGGELWVCAVGDGAITRDDHHYATFVDPEVRPA